MIALDQLFFVLTQLSFHLIEGTGEGRLVGVGMVLGEEVVAGDHQPDLGFFIRPVGAVVLAEVQIGFGDFVEVFVQAGQLLAHTGIEALGGGKGSLDFNRHKRVVVSDR